VSSVDLPLVAVCETSNDLAEGSVDVMKLSVDVRTARDEDGGVVLDIPHGRMFRLNSIAMRILSLLQAGTDESHIVTEISREFSVATEVVRADVREFLRTLEQWKLLERL
jgi:coenzyme PQQ synthesis protein D (PqqD)